MNKITTSTLPSLIAGRGIGFDRMFDLFDQAVAHTGSSFPPYNIIKLKDDTFVVEIALAGYAMDELAITQDGNKLVISSPEKEFDESSDSGKDLVEPEYLHRGIAARSFSREFVLAEHVTVDGAEFKNGILSINLTRMVPEALKPRAIEIK